MKYSRLGNSGLKVSKICLGMMTYGSKSWREWALSEEEALPMVKRALEAGINFFDTADIYSYGESEIITGNLMRSLGVRRENVVIATKLNSPMSDDVNDIGLSRKHIFDSIDHSLKRLRMDHVDLYQIHRWDYETPIEETMIALNDLVRSGKVRYIGASSMYAWQFAKAQFIAEKLGLTKFISMQNHYNLIYREEEREMIPLCEDQGVGLVPWSPLARGMFSIYDPGHKDTVRSHSDPFTKKLYSLERDDVVIRRAAEVAAKYGFTGSQVALLWLLQQSRVTAPIIGASKLAHLEQAIQAVDLSITAEDVTYLEEAYTPHPINWH